MLVELFNDRITYLIGIGGRKYEIRNICSIQGTAMENEDALGNIENYFWIIDGATDLYVQKSLLDILFLR